MKILHINAYDSGGAAKSCLRLHQGLLQENIVSKVVFRNKSQPISNTFQISDQPLSLYQRLSNRIIYIGKRLQLKPFYSTIDKETSRLHQERKGLECFTIPVSPIDIKNSVHYQEADIIHLHWVANFLDWESFFAENQKPVVWTLHDQNPFLGIEHYAERFLGIDNNGYPQNRVRTVFEEQAEKKWLEYKKRILKNIENITIATPSKWLTEQSKQSEVLGKYTHYHIPYGFPTNIFKPLNKNFCREILGLPQDKKVLLFVADYVENNRKGFVFLKKHWSR